MDHFYDLSLLTLPFGTAGAAAEALQQHVQQVPDRGEWLGCWVSDIGILNQMWMLRGFNSLDALRRARWESQRSANPLGVGEIAQAVEQHSYQGFDWMAPVRPSAESGLRGPVYEIRTYGIKPGGVQPTIDLWQQAVPARAKISPCLVAMVALDGPPRFTNIWAYPSLDARSQARAAAVTQGIWPPKGGPAWLTTAMQSTIALPTANSALQ